VLERALAPRFFHLADRRHVGDHGARPGRLRAVDDVLGAQHVRAGHGHPTRLERPDLGDERLREAREDVHHRIARLHPEPHQDRREPAREVGELAPRHRPPIALLRFPQDARLVRVGAGMPVHRPGDRVPHGDVPPELPPLALVLLACEDHPITPLPKIASLASVIACTGMGTQPDIGRSLFCRQGRRGGSLRGGWRSSRR